MKTQKKVEQFKKDFNVASDLEDFFKKQIEANNLTIGDVIYVLGTLCATALINCTLSGKKTARTYFRDLVNSIVLSYDALREQYKEEVNQKISNVLLKTENNDGSNC